MSDNLLDDLVFGSQRKKRRKITKKTGPKITPIKRTSYKADFNHLMEKQKNKCAYPICSKLHTVRQKVHSIRDLDHKISIKLWELMHKNGNPNMRSNLQLLCPGCHRHKTAEDRKKISKYKRAHLDPPKIVKLKPKKPKDTNPFETDTLFKAPRGRPPKNPFGL